MKAQESNKRGWIELVWTPWRGGIVNTLVEMMMPGWGKGKTKEISGCDGRVYALTEEDAEDKVG